MICLTSLFTTLAVIFVLKIVAQHFLSKFRTSKLFNRLAVFKATRYQKIESTSKYKSSLSAEIKQKLVKSDANTLLKMIRAREVSCYELLLVFYERAITIGIKLNALAETNIELAIEQAKKCDSILDSMIKTDPSKVSTLPPLFGLPISIKSNVFVKGLSTNLGCANFMDNKSEKDGFIVELLIKQGAIPFITSSVPQCLMICETVNRLYGRCLNPWDEGRTPGGSSGGEAALIASGCSPLGLGSDIGGSVRIPCLYTGLYGLKVTTNRLTMEGIFSGNKSNKRGQVNIKACNGPMGKSVDDIALMTKALLIEDLWKNDLEVVPLPWNQSEYQSERKLRIGYIEDDRFFAVSAGNKRAVMMAVKSLEAKGHEMVKLEFPNFEKGSIQYFSIMSSAGKFRPYRQMMADEPPIEEYSQLLKFMKIPRCLRPFLAFLLKFVHENRAAKILPISHEKSAWEYLQASEGQLVIKEEFFDWWRKNKIDALISPGLPTPAMKHGESADLFLTCCYTFYFNLLDYPTGVVPITTVKKEEELYEDKFHKDKYVRLTKESMKGSEGMPLGVQVTTLPLQEELCLNVMRQIEKGVDFHDLPIKF